MAGENAVLNTEDAEITERYDTLGRPPCDGMDNGLTRREKKGEKGTDLKVGTTRAGPILRLDVHEAELCRLAGEWGRRSGGSGAAAGSGGRFG